MNVLIFWAVLCIIMILVELFTLGLTTIWFAVGAVAAILAHFLGAPFVIQGIVFLIVSILLLYSMAPWAKQYFNKNRTKTNAQALIGKPAVVTETIDNLQSKGRVIIDGMEWTARSNENTMCIQKGTIVKIKDIQGVKLIVEHTK